MPDDTKRKTYCLKPVVIEADVGMSEFGRIPRMIVRVAGRGGRYILMDRDDFNALFQEVER